MEQDSTISEFVSVLDAVQSNINSQFELWVTITFAVIIASYIAGHKLPTLLKHLIATLCISVSLLLWLMLVRRKGLTPAGQLQTGQQRRANC